jgi:hypothetical protein
MVMAAAAATAGVFVLARHHPDAAERCGARRAVAALPATGTRPTPSPQGRLPHSLHRR